MYDYRSDRALFELPQGAANAVSKGTAEDVLHVVDWRGSIILCSARGHVWVLGVFIVHGAVLLGRTPLSTPRRCILR